MQNESKHTPGPWQTIGLDPSAIWIESDSGENIAEIDRKSGSLEQVANAHLIAAAPELLEVALALVGASPKYGTDGVCKMSTRKVVEMARVAIAKAEGNA